jgi:hypothetical protein
MEPRIVTKEAFIVLGIPFKGWDMNDEQQSTMYVYWPIK